MLENNPALRKKCQVDKYLKDYGMFLDVFTEELNEFNEPTGKPLPVAKVTAYFYRDHREIKITYYQSGERKKYTNEMLMIIADEESDKIREGHKVYIEGRLYELSDITKPLNMYYDVALKIVADTVDEF